MSGTSFRSERTQNPFERPTVKRPKRSPKPRFHVASKEAPDELEAEFAQFNLLYDLASEALRSGDLNAAQRFPPGCFPPALAFVGPPPPRRPPRPPTRTITVLESGVVEKGPIPVVVIPKTWRAVVGASRPTASRLSTSRRRARASSGASRSSCSSGACSI